MWEYSHEGKQLENKWVFRRLQKTGKVCVDVMSGGIHDLFKRDTLQILILWTIIQTVDQEIFIKKSLQTTKTVDKTQE